MTIIRLCYTHMEPFYYHEGSANHLIGNAAPLGNIALQSNNFTYDFVPKSSYGVLIDAEKRIYDGCIGSVQRNESDWALIQVSAGVYGENLVQGPAIGFEQMAILSVYNASEEVVLTHVLQAFNSFSHHLWLFTAGTMFAFAVLFSLMFQCCSLMISSLTSGSRRGREQGTTGGVARKAMKLVCGVVLKQHSSFSMRRSATFARILFLSLILFSFWIYVHFSSLIKTELAVSKLPLTIESYVDILDREPIIPTWLGLLSDKDLFQNAPNDSIEGKIWQAALTRVNQDESRIVLDREMDVLVSAVREAVDQKRAMILGRWLQPVIRKNLCAGAPILLEPSARLLTRLVVDPDSAEHVRVMAFSSLLAPHLKRQMFRRTTAVFEFGILEQVTQSDMLFREFDRQPASRMRECTSDVIVVKEPQVHKPDLLHYWTVFVLAAVGYVVAALEFLVFEVKMK